MNEFDLIRQYFTRPAASAVLGVGDDAAILRPTPGQDVHVSVDMLVEGRHFFADVSPQALGHKTLAVNLSDMAAMGARPRWAFLSLALPQLDEAWARDFSRGLFALAEQYGVDLAGGDTTRGPLTLSITIMGETPQGQALRRDAAQVGDDVWVSGELGLGAIAVALRNGQLADADMSEDVLAACQCKLDFPLPRLELGQALLGVAHAAVDVSDGLLADLGHILRASGVAAEIWADSLPSLSPLEAERARWLDYLAAGGDDYELCFTAPAAARTAVEAAGRTADCRVTRIGHVVAGSGARLLDKAGAIITLNKAGYDHFA
ncbi:thiamine-phosphate kinase [Aquitalea sp. LB_tupeE]|uniref:thiamine-phosphate kinase n=1 Tax=Aquitalea sp. LB_tupeE TaxID=2748078 RepID=UPI0015BCEB03|nr:thiamine-phosphate kinase [Aquitalea sp. LB_tupeE]NWK79971.1 thiamine-phosphate kinase [Aquitalea sp. LB_tupeE]